MPYEEKPFEAFAVGDRGAFTKTITEADLLLFAAVSGDQYPLHVDEEYARTTRFGGRIAHGMLTASLLSATNGLLAAAPGRHLARSDAALPAPRLSGRYDHGRQRSRRTRFAKRRLRCRTTCTNQSGELVVDGEAIEQKDEA